MAYSVRAFRFSFLSVAKESNTLLHPSSSMLVHIRFNFLTFGICYQSFLFHYSKKKTISTFSSRQQIVFFIGLFVVVVFLPCIMYSIYLLYEFHASRASFDVLLDIFVGLFKCSLAKQIPRSNVPSVDWRNEHVANHKLKLLGQLAELYIC